MEESNSLISGTLLSLGLDLSFDESIDGADDWPGLKLGFNVMIGRLLFVLWADFDGWIDAWGRNANLRLDELASNFLRGLIPDVCFGIFAAGILTNGVLFSGFVVLCSSSGWEESKSGNPNLIVSTLEDGTEEGRGSRSKKDDRDGTILGRIMFRVAVLNVFFGLKITTVSSIVVVKSTNPT